MASNKNTGSHGALGQDEAGQDRAGQHQERAVHGQQRHGHAQKTHGSHGAHGAQPEWADGLRQLYDSVVEEPLPDSFKDLLARFDEEDTGREPGADRGHS